MPVKRVSATPAYIALLTLAWLALAPVHSDGQTFTSAMTGESSTTFAFVNGNGARNLAWTLQSPFLFPTVSAGAYDTPNYGYPVGNALAAPPSWFVYTANSGGGLYSTFDLTNMPPYRYPSYGQISNFKSNIIGIRAKAKFDGSGSGDGFFIEAIYFSERQDWAGQREFGFFRNVSEDSRVYFYWSTNSNCSITANMGYPYCRLYQATGGQEYAAFAPVVAEHFEATAIDNIDTTRQYVWISYVFWAFWDASYKFRVEVWDDTYTAQIAGFNVDTTSDSTSFGVNSSGLSGYITLATQRRDPFYTSNSQLSVTSVETVR
jgi:hypothetical protein